MSSLFELLMLWFLLAASVGDGRPLGPRAPARARRRTGVIAESSDRRERGVRSRGLARAGGDMRRPSSHREPRCPSIGRLRPRAKPTRSPPPSGRSSRSARPSSMKRSPASTSSSPSSIRSWRRPVEEIEADQGTLSTLARWPTSWSRSW